MLDAIRKRSGGIVVKILLLFLVLSFGAWGVGDYIGGAAGGDNVASVGEYDISSQEFSNEMQREMNRMRQYFGDAMDADMAREMGLPNQVVARMVRSALYLAAAKDQGLVVDDAQVTAEIHSIDAFKGLTGEFDKDAFRGAINNAGYSEESFIRLVRDDLKRATFVDSFSSGVVGSNVVAKLLHGYRAETRSADFAIIEDAQFTDIPVPSEADISAFHSDNQDQFMAPEYRSVSYLQLLASDLADTSSVSEEEIHDAYELRKAEFMVQGRREVLQAIFSDEATAKSVADMIVKGRDFAETAQEVAGINPDSLALGWVRRADLLSEELADVVFNTPAGSVSPPANSMLGWHLFKVINAEEKMVQELDTVRADLAKGVALEKAIDALYEQANVLEDELGSGATLEDAAQNLGLRIMKVDSIDRRGRDRSGVAVENLPSADFVATAFATEESTDSALIESNGDTYFVMHIDGVDVPILRPLEDVRHQVVASINAIARSTSALASAEKVAAALNTATTLSSAVMSGVEVKTAANFKRDGSSGDALFPRDFTGELAGVMFEKAIGQGGFSRVAQGYAVAHLKSITKADTVSNMDAISQIKSELSQSIAADLYEQLANALEERIPVNINNNALNQTF